MKVVLLDPVMYPGALKAFAKEICRNDLLNFGRLHFFFPDSRLALDLNTDKALKASLSLGEMKLISRACPAMCSLPCFVSCKVDEGYIGLGKFKVLLLAVSTHLLTLFAGGSL